MTDLLDDDVIDLRRRAKTDPAAVIDEERRRRTILPRENAELTRSTNEAEGLPSKVSEGPSDPALPPGICPICRTRPARTACRSCGRIVCAADSWVMLSLCTGCASEDAVRRYHRGSQAEQVNWLEGKK